MSRRLSIRCTALLAALFIVAGCTNNTPEAVKTANDAEAAGWVAPRYIAVRPRIAYEDRYLYLDSDALIIDGSLYCTAEELLSSLPFTGELPQTVTYKGKEYAPVRDYYASLGLIVIWDAELGLVRVYERAPVYGDKASEKKVHVLLYHHILKDSENVKFRDNGTVISEEAFEAQMKYLSDNGYTAITLIQLYDFLYSARELPDKSVLITFDDGYYSNLTRAYPILKKYGLSAVIFTITSRVYQTREGGFDPDIAQYFAVDDLKAHSDVFEYASHTHALHDYDKNDVTLLSKADRDAIIEDLDRSFFTVNNNMAFAYPLGQYSGVIIDTLRETPVKLAFTTKSGAVRSGSDPLKLGRHIIWSSMDIRAFARLLK